MIRLKTNNLKLDVSGSKWYSVEYAGTYELQTKDDYEGYFLLSEDDCGLAKNNAKLASYAPDLIKIVDELREALTIAKTGGDYLKIELEQLNKVENKAINLLKEICNG